MFCKIIKYRIEKNGECKTNRISLLPILEYLILNRPENYLNYHKNGFRQFMTEYTQTLIETFGLHADPENAGPMSKYMKNKFEFLGIKSPSRKEISKVFLQKENLPAISELPTIIRELWDVPQREIQYFTLDLIQKYHKIMPEDWLSLIEDLIVSKSWWDTVDGLASWQVGDYFRKFPQHRDTTILRWLDSENIWLQRTCLIFQLRYKSDTDFELLKFCIARLAHSREFFIQKAIGWALRQLSKLYPSEVLDFVENNTLPKLSYREATRLI